METSQSIKWRHLWLLLTFSLWAFVDAGFGQHPSLNRVKALLIADERASDIGPRVSAGISGLQNALGQIFNEPQLPTLQGRASIVRIGSRAQPALTPSLVRETILRLAVGSDETLFIAYHGHGEVNDLEGQVYRFADESGAVATGKSLLRRELLDMVREVNAPLSIVVTDCCSSQFNVAAAPAPGEWLANPRVCEDLFFRNRGLTEMSGASQGQAAWADESGGLFTQSLSRQLTASLYGKTVDDDGDGFSEWPEVFRDAKSETADLYRMLSPRNEGIETSPRPVRGQATQDPVLLSSAGGGLYLINDVHLRPAAGGKLSIEADWTVLAEEPSDGELYVYFKLANDEDDRTYLRDTDHQFRSPSGYTCIRKPWRGQPGRGRAVFTIPYPQIADGYRFRNGQILFAEIVLRKGPAVLAESPKLEFRWRATPR